MSLLAWALVVTALAPPSSSSVKDARFAALVGEVLSADYRGDRAALARLDAILGELDGSALADYREYWRGFARWRRALNGFNEKPAPADLAEDLESAVGHFRKSLDSRPDWIEAQLALVGCWGSLAYLARDDAERMKGFLAELIPASRWLDANGRDNPRALWILGGMQFSAPPPYGGDLVKGAATMRRGVELSWRDSISGASSPAWVPAWGGAENLANLAYMYSHVGKPDRAAALAYAQGAVTAVPQWHYVRDVLLPQIEALPEDAPAH